MFWQYLLNTNSPHLSNSQAVWKKSTELGCAAVFKRHSPTERRTYVCCNYFSRGNVDGQYLDNVEPPMDIELAASGVPEAEPNSADKNVMTCTDPETCELENTP